VRSVKLVSNSADSQLLEADTHFRAVERAAREYERHQGRSNELLRSALSELYTFGEMLRTQATEPGRSLVEEFVTSKGLPWNAVTQRNPYNAFVKLAFQQSASSQSQYAAVLSFASDCRVELLDFSKWLQDGGGIKGRYPEAAEHYGSARKQRNSQERASRLKLARELLSARTHSQPVALPQGVAAPEGFALVLAKVDAAGNAVIIDVVKNDEAALEPVILSYAPNKATAKAALAAEPLGPLYRAIDLILGCSADKTGGHDRHVLLLNSFDRGSPICLVQAVSRAYTYAWAGMTLSGHVPGLPLGEPFILRSKDAAFFKREFANYRDWDVCANPSPCIQNGRRDSTIELLPLDTESPYRIGSVPPRREKPVLVSCNDQQSVLRFLRERLDEHERRSAKEKVPFSSTVIIRSEGGRLEISLPTLLALSAVLGVSSPDRELSNRGLGTSDLTNVLASLTSYETDMEGTFIDSDVPDAGLCLQAWFDDDLLSVVVPTRSGKAVNQSCVDLNLRASS